MKVDRAVVRETTHIAIGLLAVDVLLCVVFAILRRFDYTVVLGALLGSAFSLLNFFLLGLTVQKVVHSGEEPKKAVRTSYSLRMLLVMAILVVGIVAPCFHVIAVIVPFLATQPIILLMRRLGVGKEEEEREEEQWRNSDYIKNRPEIDPDGDEEGEW